MLHSEKKVEHPEKINLEDTVYLQPSEVVPAYFPAIDEASDMKHNETLGNVENVVGDVVLVNEEASTTIEQSSSCPKSALSAALPNANSNTDDHDVLLLVTLEELWRILLRTLPYLGILLHRWKTVPFLVSQYIRKT